MTSSITCYKNVGGGASETASVREVTVRCQLSVALD
jgi:hypothetical protein